MLIALHRASKICLLGQREGRPLRSEQIAVVVAVSDKKEGRKEARKQRMSEDNNERKKEARKQRMSEDNNG